MTAAGPFEEINSALGFDGFTLIGWAP